MKLKHKIKRHICVTLTLVAASSFAAQDIILADDGKAGDSFGYSVSIDGTTALVGAFKADIDGVIDAGAAYVYVLGDNGWQKQAKLVAEPAFADDTLGGKVALKNNVAMLGVMRRDDKGKDSGAVVSFEREVNTWKQRQIFTAPASLPNASFRGAPMIR